MIRRWGWRNFTAAVRRELGATRWYFAIVRAVFDAATDPAHAEVGVSTQRAGALERVEFALADLAARRGAARSPRSKPACSVCSTSST